MPILLIPFALTIKQPTRHIMLETIIEVRVAGHLFKVEIDESDDVRNFEVLDIFQALLNQKQAKASYI